MAASSPGQARRSAVSGWPSPSPHFARVAPIVGADLRRARVALTGLPVAAPIVTHLAACGVSRWLWADPGDGGPTTLQARLLAQHGPALALDANTLSAPAWAAAVRSDAPDLLIAVGDATETRALIREAQVPTLLITPPTATHPCQATSLFTGDDAACATGSLCLSSLSPPLSSWDWITAAPLCAGLARAMLLRDTPYRRADLEDLWQAGVCRLTLGGGDDPLAVRWSPSDSPLGEAPTSGQSAPFRTPTARRGNLLIAGLGSLGSVAAMYLSPHVAAMIVADPDRVDVYNPVRQAYPLAAVGQPKARALCDGLLKAGAKSVVAIESALTDEDAVVDLVQRHGVTAALVVTGTAADFAIARALRACDVPHLVGRCYPRARYWEAILVDGRRGPALSDLRGHLRLGPAPPPTPEQVAAYSDAGALEAEPATLVESGWAAAWMARLTAQLLAPPGLRERWLLELLASARTCFVGGVGVERTPGGPAYDVALPGQIRAWGRAEIINHDVNH